MGMPILVELTDAHATEADYAALFDYFADIDRRFSPYKDDSEVSRLNRGESMELSAAFIEVLDLSERTRLQTGGFFNIKRPDGRIDPSGLVKGWAIAGAARLLRERNLHNFYVDAGGDIQTSGVNAAGAEWRIGIRSPFSYHDIVKVLVPRGKGVATSGSAARGAHIYNPLAPQAAPAGVASITVVGPDVLEADRFATAAFAMGKSGVEFIETLPGLEAYQVGTDGIATQTTGFGNYTA